MITSSNVCPFHCALSVPLTADVRRVSRGLQSERRAGSVAMPTCLPQEVSTGEHSGVFLCSCYHSARLPGLVENENAHVRSRVSVIWTLHRTIGSWLQRGTAGRLVQQR